MFYKSFLRKVSMSEENSNGHFNPKYKAQSTSQLLSTDSVMIKSISATTSPTSSTSSLAIPHSPKNHFSSFLKIPLSNRKSNLTQSTTEDRFVMTIIKSPSTNSQRIASNSSNDLTTTPIPSITIHEDTTNNGKVLKNKVTAAFNHMKYRKFREFIY